MKKLNVFLLIVLILLVGLLIYFFAGASLHAQAHVISAPAADHPDAFASIRNVLSSGSAPQQFTGDIAETPDGYTLLDVTISLSNRGLFPAEWLDIAVTPATGDVAVYSLTGEGGSIPAHSTGQVNLKLITTANASVARMVTIRYYVYGMLKTITLAA